MCNFIKKVYTFVGMKKQISFNPANLLTIKEYADFKKITRKTVYNWLQEGHAKDVLIRGKRFIDKTTGKH